ncbi:keto-hydroxyglutarate-aldolase/keto-deoxy-phosphogluconate aldolase [Acidipropionibacterium jensenii]|uniref:Keto-hydroxyglutarate-aldolase/keto-deoxy-phosphogluconate aldolase n=2 Tax=Acidipropionibacterium jensenii TaxID=1749 RepID=A0A448NY77_9ACTN|nr:keto-hydroxyglutarate-aldolase/keto-deoxy-phosphogluconate aldolase [Acidipropionibacterium jensenii]
MMGAMSSDPAPTVERLPLPEPVLASRIVAVLPDVAAADLFAPVEVMVEEGIKVFSLPAGDLERFTTVTSVFGARASFAVHGVMTIDEIDPLVAAGVSMCLPVAAAPELLAELRAAGIAAAPDALTPIEVRAAWAAGADAVQVIPADLGGATYGESLAALAPGAVCVPRGGVGSYAMRNWLMAGAPAVCLDDTLVGDACRGGTLPSLRERCRSVLAVITDIRA